MAVGQLDGILCRSISGILCRSISGCVFTCKCRACSRRESVESCVSSSTGSSLFCLSITTHTERDRERALDVRDFHAVQYDTAQVAGSLCSSIKTREASLLHCGGGNRTCEFRVRITVELAAAHK